MGIEARCGALAVLVLLGCGGSVSEPPASTDAGARNDARVSDAPAPSAAVRCWPTDPNPGYDLACSPTSQMCVDDYAGVGHYPTPKSCQPMVEACAQDRTCACIAAHFHCGLATTCSISSTGVVRVTCQPD